MHPTHNAMSPVGAHVACIPGWIFDSRRPYDRLLWKKVSKTIPSYGGTTKLELSRVIGTFDGLALVEVQRFSSARVLPASVTLQQAPEKEP